MNPLLMVGVVLNSLVTLSLFAADEYPPFIAQTMSIFDAISLLGIMMILFGAKKAGAITAFIGCVVFIPLGLIGAIGARRVLDELNREEFEKRRSEKSG